MIMAHAPRQLVTSPRDTALSAEAAALQIDAEADCLTFAANGLYHILARGDLATARKMMPEMVKAQTRIAQGMMALHLAMEAMEAQPEPRKTAQAAR